MSTTSAREFIDRLGTDAGFRASITSAADEAAKKAIITNAGYDFTADELNQVVAHQDTSAESRDHAVDSVRNVAPADVTHNVVGMYMATSGD